MISNNLFFLFVVFIVALKGMNHISSALQVTQKFYPI
jgi:hypothetical protein